MRRRMLSAAAAVSAETVFAPASAADDGARNWVGSPADRPQQTGEGA